MSEWALCNQAAWAYLRPILAENNGWALFNTTPRGRNHAYRTFQAAQKEPGHFAELLTAHQTSVFTAEQLATERRQLIADYGEEYGDGALRAGVRVLVRRRPTWAQLWAARSRRAERDGRVAEDCRVRSAGAPIEISSDIGFSDAAAWWFWQP